MPFSSTEEVFAAIPAAAETVRFGLEGGTHCFTELPNNIGNSQCGDIVEALVLFTFNLSGTPAGTAILAGYNAYKAGFNLLQVALGREPTSPVGAGASSSSVVFAVVALLVPAAALLSTPSLNLVPRPRPPLTPPPAAACLLFCAVLRRAAVLLAGQMKQVVQLGLARRLFVTSAFAHLSQGTPHAARRAPPRRCCCWAALCVIGIAYHSSGCLRAEALRGAAATARR